MNDLRDDNKFRRLGWLPWALWTKYWREAWPLLVSLTLLLSVMQWLRVWITSQVNLGALEVFLKAMPPAFEKLAGVPVSAIATPTGRIAMGYVDPFLIFVCAVWAIARGSDCVSGEIGRGSMEMLLAQPVRRSSIVMVHGLGTSLGAAILAASCWVGTWAGLHTFKVPAAVDAMHFVPAAMNVFGLMFFLAGVSTLVSSSGSQRWRTVGILGGFYVVETLVKVVSRVTPGLNKLMYGTYLTAFEPQLLVIVPEEAWSRLIVYNGWLLGLGLVAYLTAIVVFNKRDLPAPL